MDGTHAAGATTDDVDTEADLPTPAPLAHDTFLAHEWDADAFLLDRRHSSLEDLRSDLRAYLANLRNELVGVINEDYEDFIGLGIGLRGTEKRLDRMQRPVERVRTEIDSTRTELVDVQTAIQAKLNERSAIREQKATLRLLLSINDSVLKVEALLLIESPPETAGGGPIASTSGLESARPFHAGHSALQTAALDRAHGSGVKRVERVAAEYNQLLYLMEKADGLAFVTTLDRRVEQIRKTLQSDMSSLLSSALHAMPPSADALYDILRIFQATRKAHEAEDVVRKEVVRPWVQKNISRESLSGPLSPALPQTPGLSSNHVMPNGFHVNGTASPKPLVEAIPCQTWDPLIDLYNKILAFASRDCAAFLEAADRRSRFSMLVHVVWEEILARLTAELGHIIFAAGRADSFHSNYMATAAFISRFEGLCVNQKQLLSLRANDTTQSFQKRWQRPIYFQLRFKEIVTRLEESLDVRIGLENRAAEKSPFLLAATEATHRAIWTCWQPDIVLDELTPRFWKLTLQLLSRYKRWLDSVMPSYLPSSQRPSLDGVRDTNRLNASIPASRTGTPAPPEVTEETTVKQLTLIIVDVRRLEGHTNELFDTVISPLLQTVADHDTHPREAMVAAAASVAAIAPSLVSQIVSALVRQCNEPLRPSLRSVVSEVRASNKPAPPTTPSHLTSRVLKPLKSYFESFPGKALDSSSRQQLAGEVLEEIAVRYASVLNDNREAEASLRRLKKGRQGFSLFGRSAADDTAADDGNVKIQLQLDAEAFAKEAVTLGVDIGDAKGFAALRQAVQ